MDITYNRNCKNYGLEKLSIELQTEINENEEKAFQRLYKDQIPEMQILERISSFSVSDFHFTWSILIMICNLYNYFTVPYFLGIPSFPSGFWLGLEMMFEFIMILDFIGRCLYKDLLNTKYMWLLEEEDCVQIKVFMAISSIPYSFISAIINIELDSLVISLLRCGKLLRYFQITTFFNNLEVIRKEGSIYVIELLKLMLLLFACVHYLSCIWLLVARLENMNRSSAWNDYWVHNNASQFELYLDSLFWAVEALTGIIIGKTLKFTYYEMNLCVAVMIIGALTYARIFGRLVAILEKENFHKEDNRIKLEIAKIWSKQRKLTPELKHRLSIYYKIARLKFSNQLQYKFMDDLPLSLKTEVALFMFRDLTSKVKLFELGDTTFMMSMVRNLRPRLYMMGDYVVRQGDYATEFYIIRTGVVEVLASDGRTQIALLNEGSYFGEIGVLLGDYRTVSVRACDGCIICYIAKEVFLEVLSVFQDHLRFLLQVAEQRRKCIDVEDFDQQYEIMEDSSSSSESDNSDELEPPKFFTERGHRKKTWIQKLLTLPRSNAPSDRLIIDPLSTFYYIWSGLLTCSYVYYMYYIPFAIAFEDDGVYVFRILNLFFYSIYILDVYISLCTAIITEFGTYVHSKQEIKNYYLKNFFLLDIICLMPFDIVIFFINSPQYVIAYLRLFYLLKYKKIRNSIKIIIKNSSRHSSLIRLGFIVFILLYFSHFFGCSFFYIAKFQYYYYPNSRFDHMTYIKQFDEVNSYMSGLLDLSLLDQYIIMIYQGISLLSLGSYGDISPVTSLEKIYCIVWLLISRFLVAFLYAEASTFTGSMNGTYVKHLTKVNLVKQWINHNDLSDSLKKRILNYYDLLLRKLKGCNDEDFLNDLPEALRTDISHYLFYGLTTSGLFPEADSGAILSIIRKCKVQVYCVGEAIINEGEIGLEMFFIMEGDVRVVSNSRVNLTILKQGDYFGEIALINPICSVRQASVIANTEVTLAVLSLQDYKHISSIFPKFSEKVIEKAAQRELMNRTIFQQENLESIKEYQRFEQNFDQDISSNSEIVNCTEINNDFPVFVEVTTEKYLVMFNKSKLKFVFYVVVWIWNIIYIPYKLAFNREFQGFELLLETISVLVYLIWSIYYYKLFISLKNYSNNFPEHTKTACLINFFHHILLSFPFLLVFDNISDEIYGNILSLFRLSNFYMAIPVFSHIKKNINWFNTISIIEILSIYFLINHILACYFIVIEKEFFLPYSWLYMLDTKLSDSSLYIYGLYWANSNTSHTSLGDIKPFNSAERLYCCFVFTVGCLSFGMLFGYIAALVSGISSHLKSNLQDSYLYVKDFVKKKKVDGKFNKLVEDYYNYLWQNSKGILEEDILKDLPASIKTSIQISRFSIAIGRSQVFKNSQDDIDYKITLSIFRIITIQYYLVGDSIIQVGDKSNEMYIILEGEVDVLNLQGKKVLATLKEGAHFGEANIILKNSIRTATIVATKISKVGILTEENLEILFEAYPEWYEKLKKILKSRMRQTFRSSRTDEVIKQVRDISEKLTVSPKSYKKYTKRSEKLMAPKIANLLAKTSGGKWITLTTMHLLLILYSAVTIPYIIGFNIQMTSSLIFIECVVILESLIYFLLNLKVLATQSSIRMLKPKKILGFYWRNYILEDFIALSPFNLIFSLSSNDTQGVIIALRMIRLFSIFRANSLIEKLEMHNKNYPGIIRFARIITSIVLIMHWSGCSWYFVSSSCKNSWVDLVNIRNETTSIRYEYSLYYVMNIISGTGYNNTYPVTDKERMFSIIYSIIGSGLFAISFGIMASISQIKITNLQEMMNNIRSPFSYINKSDIPVVLKNKLELYYAFITGLTQNIGPIDFKTLYLHLPPNIVGTIIYECNKNMLKKLPFLAQSESSEMIEKISLYLTPQIYLPDDYIIYKNDIGEQMFFIILGSVNILGPDNHKVVKILKKGDFFGEVALLTNSTRICSVVSNGPSLIYCLNKSDFLSLSDDYPDLIRNIEQEAFRRKIEISNIKDDREDHDIRLEVQEDLVNTITMYSAISASYFSRNGPQKRLSLLAGMKNYNSDVIKESYNTGLNQRLHKRRPYLNSPRERRLSQESIGKEVVLSKFQKLF